ncbi:MAG: argininosuccinate lyase [Christensenellales bacterium]|jgi:argininosuccinate lyase|nr:argininosuccinate lyase [Clostridiales bacterium]
MEKLWNGRFSSETDKLADIFNSSLPVDKKMYRQDITASIAHASMLVKCDIIPKEEGDKIINGLKDILQDIDKGILKIDNAEDIHMFVESELTRRIGEAGKKLHTARSRNDQVVTDFKMYIKDSILEIKRELKSFINTLLSISSKNLYTYMPGFTHLQKAQPITLAFHLCAYAEMFYRDLMRYDCFYKQINVCPLGSGALAGTTYPIDRRYTASLLGFADITMNAMDAVSDRDYVCEYLFNASMVMMHLSRFSEEIIMWASDEYKFIELSDSFSTGSSIMPQKKNPDMAELVRGKTSRVYGNLMAMLAILKGLPLAYNKDLQEDKDLVFQTESVLLQSLTIFNKMLQKTVFNKKNMKKSAMNGYTNATDFADYLTKKGLPFREAHNITGKLVSYCVNRRKPIEKLPLNILKEFSNVIEEDIYSNISLKSVVGKRDVDGGTAPSAVKKSISRLKKAIIKC